jgi:hypothetical protein
MSLGKPLGDFPMSDHIVNDPRSAVGPMSHPVEYYPSQSETLQSSIAESLNKSNRKPSSKKASKSSAKNSETEDGEVKRQKHVRRACVHCKKAHLACDEGRPCRRCLHLGKTDCVDVEHKRRGRPRTSPEKKKMQMDLKRQQQQLQRLAQKELAVLAGGKVPTGVPTSLSTETLVGHAAPVPLKVERPAKADRSKAAKAT